ncbi:helix-turn-helix domain-containing protein [Flavobacterium sp. ZT3R18]|uniref:helix-turn-helix domain-containing protein n=1 Tax=Flavobacterium sp. ZT3R18 TaxID=2594429 RepID=UPI00117A66EB|nr:helix-turn-helix domain-containing protein [Flavobacterium sp. ZT3R18]TRX32982.1 helix-turn-helix domain-containing protein [Flavobacterium sp. ZT3R18]
MAATIITTEDLIEFKKELLEEIKKIFESQTTTQNKKWLKSAEVRELLNISPGTLQNLRINGTLSYTKIGGIMYYDNQDIDKLLEKNKVSAFPNLFK